MIKKIFSVAVIAMSCLAVQADVQKVAVVDVQKVVNKSAQVQALKKDREAKRQETVKFIQKASEEIKKEKDVAKQKSLSEKYGKELKAKQEANTKAYQTKLNAIDKDINAAVVQQAKAMGYDLVLTKGVVLYGGDDITEAIIKVVK